MTRLRWRRCPWGWTAQHGKDRLAIYTYCVALGGTCYVLRVNGSALSSPAVPYRTAREAREAAQRWALTR